MPIGVLIVDDHASFRATARVVLDDAGYVVVGEAVDAASALAAARALRPDCVLLDVQLGDVDGLSVAQALAHDGDVPVVVLTSGRDPRDVEPLVEAIISVGMGLKHGGRVPSEQRRVSVAG